MQPLIMPFGGKTPQIHESAFVAPGVVIIGDVEIGPDASVWYGSVLRGDANKIVVGARSNVQDGTIIHVDEPTLGGTPCIIGEDVLIGHKCMLHGCTLEDKAFIGMNATVLDGAVVEAGGFLAAGAFLGAGKRLPSGEMWAGLPARKFRDLSERDAAMVQSGAPYYVHEAASHKQAVADHLGD